MERKHDRAAILEGERGARRETMPDWRFLRHAIRIALYLRDRCGVAPGDSVLLWARWGFDAAVLDWACFMLGAAVVVVPDDAGVAVALDAVRVLEPRALFLGPSASDEVLLAASSRRQGSVVALDGVRDGANVFSEVLDLGGTLDTAERANTLRDAAERLAADTVAFVEAGPGHPAHWRRLRHVDLLTRWATRGAPVAGDAAYIGHDQIPLDAQVTLLGFMADGRTRTVLGRNEGEPERVAGVYPRWVVAADGSVRERTDRAAVGTRDGVLERVPKLFNSLFSRWERQT